jgi:outer membrane protein TolC
LLAISVSCVWAEDGKQIDLNQALEMALAYSPSLEQAREALVGAEQQEKKAFTSFLPTVKTSYQFLRLDEPVASNYGVLGTLTSKDEETYTWTTTVQQPLFTGFRLLSTYRLAGLGVDLARVQKDLAGLDLVLAVKQGYFQYLSAQKAQEVARQSVTLLEAHLKTSRDFHEVGIIPINDVLKVEVELATAQKRQVEAENAVALAMSSLNILLGRPVNQELNIKDLLSYQPHEIDQKTAINKARDLRPELKAMGLQLEQADQLITQAQADFYPQVTLQGQYIKEGTDWDVGGGGGTEPNSWNVAAGVSWDVWQWGRTYREVSSRRADKRKLKAAERDLHDQVVLQVQQAYLYLRETEKTIVAAKAAVTSAEENYRITNERFKEQLTTNTELLDAQNLLTQARNDYLNALSVYNIAWASLERAMGLGMPKITAANR